MPQAPTRALRLCAVARNHRAGCRSRTSRDGWRDTAGGGASHRRRLFLVHSSARCHIAVRITPCQPVDHDPLTPLFSPLTTLKGVGPTVGALIAKVAGGERVIDLLFHLPESYLDRRQRPTIAQARPGQIVTLAVEVVRIEPPANARQPWRVAVKDADRFRRSGLLQIQSGTPDAGRRQAAGVRQDRAVRRPSHDLAPRARRPSRPARTAAGNRASLAADRRSLASPGGQRHGASAGTAAFVSRVARRGAVTAREMARLRRGACARSRRRRTCRRRPIAPASPTTNCWPTRSRSRSSAAGLRLRPGRGLNGDGTLRAKALSRFGHPLTALAASGAGRDRCRSRVRSSHAAPAAGRRGIRQDGGGAAGDAARGRGRQAGRA